MEQNLAICQLIKEDISHQTNYSELLNWYHTKWHWLFHMTYSGKDVSKTSNLQSLDDKTSSPLEPQPARKQIIFWDTMLHRYYSINPTTPLKHPLTLNNTIKLKMKTKEPQLTLHSHAYQCYNHTKKIAWIDCITLCGMQSSKPVYASFGNIQAYSTKNISKIFHKFHTRSQEKRLWFKNTNFSGQGFDRYLSCFQGTFQPWEHECSSIPTLPHPAKVSQSCISTLPPENWNSGGGLLPIHK